VFAGLKAQQGKSESVQSLQETEDQARSWGGDVWEGGGGQQRDFFPETVSPVHYGKVLYPTTGRQHSWTANLPSGGAHVSRPIVSRFCKLSSGLRDYICFCP
jgi:hypothetical protein